MSNFIGIFIACGVWTCAIFIEKIYELLKGKKKDTNEDESHHS